MIETRLVDLSIHTTQQDVICRQTLECRNHLLRLTVRSNAYRFQCLAWADIWSERDLRWNRVCSIPGEKMSTPEGLYALPGRDGQLLQHFQWDLTTLRNRACAIIFPDRRKGELLP